VSPSRTSTRAQPNGRAKATIVVTSKKPAQAQ
jgi:hypothetical protein